MALESRADKLPKVTYEIIPEEFGSCEMKKPLEY